jgi:hypothetical protein
MLEHIRRAKAVISAGVVAVSATGAILLDHALAAPMHSWSGYLSVGIVSVLALGFERLADIAIAHSADVRKMLSGDDYIEGIWIEVYQSRDAETYHFCVLTINCGENAMRLSGVTYGSPDILERGRWKSEAARYKNGSLFYFYEERVGDTPVTGSGRLDFNNVGGYPRRYQSDFFDPVHMKAVGFGYRLETQRELQAVRSGGVELRNLLRSYAKEAAVQPRQS